jgi:hypothetical protein
MGKLNPMSVFIFLPEQFAEDPEIALLRERVRRQAFLVS